uniref:Uncharacterized protein n=1 Tax=Anguilla anguilla TaxID=7936 RepID=A0A0E9UGD0_ANGAN
MPPTYFSFSLKLQLRKNSE